MQMQLDRDDRQAQVWLRVLPEVSCRRLHSVEGRAALPAGTPRVRGLRRAGLEHVTSAGHALLGATFSPAASGPLRASVHVSEGGAPMGSTLVERLVFPGLSEEQAQMVLESVLEVGHVLGPGRLEISPAACGEGVSEACLRGLGRGVVALLQLDAAAAAGVGASSVPDRALVERLVFAA